MVDSITNSMDMNLRKVQETVKDREVQGAQSRGLQRVGHNLATQQQGGRGHMFPTQGSNPGLPPCRQILYQLSYWGSPITQTSGQLGRKLLIQIKQDKKPEIRSGYLDRVVKKGFSEEMISEQRLTVQECEPGKDPAEHVPGRENSENKSPKLSCFAS